MDYDQNSGDEARVGLLNRGGADFKSASKKIRVWHCDFFLAPSITENQAFWGGRIPSRPVKCALWLT